MEKMKKDQSPLPVVSLGSKLRYPIRSAARLKPAAVDSLESSSSRRAKPASSVSQSVGVLDLSAKDKSAKPPRRLSIPTKSLFSPHSSAVGSITPISETRLNRSIVQGKSDTPLSDASKSSTRRKFCVLSSVSYWMTQIKLSELASKHSISLGFFKLALDSGCEPLQRLREELKSYVRRHNLLVELEDAAKVILQCYNVLEDIMQDNETHSSSASTEARKLKPKTLISNSLSVAEKKTDPVGKDRASNVKNQRKNAIVKPSKGNAKAKSPVIESTNNEATIPMPTEEVSSCDDKENMDSQSMDAAAMKEELQAS